MVSLTLLQFKLSALNEKEVDKRDNDQGSKRKSTKEAQVSDLAS